MAKEGKKGRPKPPAGEVRCLKCQRPFTSPDRVRIRICSPCKRNPERTGRLGDRVFEVHDVPIPTDRPGRDDLA